MRKAMFKIFKAILLTLPLFLSACTTIDDAGECVYAGDEISRVNKEIVVKAKPENLKNYADLWVDSKVDVVQDQIVRINVVGSLNLCDFQEDGAKGKDCKTSISGKQCNASQVEVHSVLCSDFTKPKYPDKYPYDTGFSAASACPTTGAFSSTMRYERTGVRVNEGDSVKFSLIPTEIKIDDCDALPNGVTLEDDWIYGLDSSVAGLTGAQICKQKQKLYNVRAGDKTGMELGGYEGKTYKVTVTNDPSPKGNKWTHTRQNTGYPMKDWILGADLDLRAYPKKPLEDLNASICPPSRNPKAPCSAASFDPEYLKYDSYTISNLCARMYHITNIMSPFIITFYKDESMQDIHPGSAIGQVCTTRLDGNRYPIMRAAGLVAKIGGGVALSASGSQFLPTSNIQSVFRGAYPAGPEEVSVRLDYPYKIDNGIKDEEVMLVLADWDSHYHDSAGGYHVRVERECSRQNGAGLYFYVDKSPPTGKPGVIGMPISDLATQADGTYFMNESGSAQHEGRIYLAVYDPDIDPASADLNEVYSDNSGQYTVTLETNHWKPIISDLLKGIIEPVKRWINGEYDASGKLVKKGFARKAYDNIIADTGFAKAVQALLILYVTVYGILFTLGIVQRTQKDLVIMIFKIGVLIQLVDSKSWDFFEDYFFALFTKGFNDFFNIFSTYLGAGSDFAFLDSTFGIFFVVPTWKLLISLIFAGPVGWVMFAIILWGVFYYFGAMFTFIMLYFMAIMGVALLLSIAPIFLSFILFKQTMKLFQNWLKQLLSFIVQPLILFIALAFINQIMRIILQELFNFSACADCLIKLNFGGEFKSFCFIKFFVPMGFGGHSIEDRVGFEQGGNVQDGEFFGLPVTIVGGITFVIMVHVMRKFVEIAQAMVMSMFGFLPGSMSIPGAAMQAVDQLKSVVGMDDESRARRQDSRSMFERYHANREASQKRADVKFTGGEGDQAKRTDAINVVSKGDPGKKP
ncbi:hypothetical protein RLOatenuis_2950 [Rickettsiales bacterium]|nr:hypothetical protein RLOatenuis_2950 [Rickettsiales bacterium]